MKSGIVVYVEHRDGHVRPASLEALGEAKRLKAAGCGDVTAVILGTNVQAVAETLGTFGADRAIAIDQGFLASFDCALFGKALAEAVRDVDPGLVLMAASTTGRDLAPYLAATLDAGYAADCIALVKDGSGIAARRPVFGGKAISTVACNTDPFVVTLRPKMFEAAPKQAGATAAVKVLPPKATPDVVRAVARSVIANQTGTLDVAEADIIVAGGRGVGAPEGFKPLEELAKTLNAAVGASRAVVDLGWRDHAAQVGQTGKTVSPTLYIACGVSGAIQHLAGMRTSKVIVAVNRDPEAPIFKVATYGIVGDLFEVVPALTTAFKEALATRHA